MTTPATTNNDQASRVGERAITLSARLPWAPGTPCRIVDERWHVYIGDEFLLEDLDGRRWWATAGEIARES